MQKHLLLSAATLLVMMGCDTKPSAHTDTPVTPPSEATLVKTSWCISDGPIYTAIDASPTATAVAVKDGLITYVSHSEPEDGWCDTYAGLGARSFNLEGSAMYPGFTDSHGHLLWIGLREMMVNMTGTTSIVDMQSRLKTAVASTDKYDVIHGRGWIETHWPEARFPTKEDLDAIAPDHIVLLGRSDGHAMVVNSAALKAAAIDGNTTVPFGGDILKDENGEPTGMLIDKAMDLVNDLIPKSTEERRKKAYIKASEVYTRRGWTNIHSMSVDRDNLDLMQRLSDSGDLALRVYNSPDTNSVEDLETLLGMSPDADGLIRTRAIKLYTDGALGSRGAALLAEYDDDPGNTGLMLIKRAQIMPILEMALRKGVQVNTHAIGDRANSHLLDWYEAAFAAVPPQDRAIADPRWRIEHAQILTLKDINRFKALGVIPSMQPSHAIGDLHFAYDRIGAERLKGGYAWKSLIESGTIIAGGSDAPVEVGSPLIEFYAATVRKDLEGYSNENWYRDERVSPQDALKMFTIWPAYAAFQDEMVGTLEVGKRADFTIFDTDIMTASGPDILSTKTVMTIVDGTVVYRAK